jgi:hypothetical protein
VYGGIGGEENVREEVDVVSLRLLLQGPGEENEDRTKKNEYRIKRSGGD